MPRIAREFITERLLPAVDIERLIGASVKLKKSGGNYMGCCPFHHEKTPSFCVTPAKQMFYCFGCKKGGNAITFLQLQKNLSFPDAVEELARFAGLDVEYEAGAPGPGAETYASFYDLTDRCADFFTRMLFSPEHRAALEYFEQQRGLLRSTIIAARLGFAPADGSALIRAVARNDEDRARLETLGMAIRSRRDGSYFSMFRNRIMIPIADRRGRIVAFGGRTMGQDQPKYINNKETPIFRKRNEIFGLYDALRACQNRPPRMVIVEGYLDVLSVRQAGCPYAVASLGTATTAEQFRTLFRHTGTVVCCYDGDAAGRHAAWHALETVTPVLQEEQEVRFAFLPPADDPDSLVRRDGLNAFNRYLDEARSYPEFLVAHLQEQYRINDPGQMSLFITAALRQIGQIPLAPLRAVCLQVLAVPTKLNENRLFSMLQSQAGEIRRAGGDSATDARETGDGGRGILSTPMRKLVAFLLQEPTAAATVYRDFELELFLDLCTRMQIQGTAEARFLLDRLKANLQITPAQITELVRDTPREHMYARLMQAPLPWSKTAADVEPPFAERIRFLGETLTAILTQEWQRRMQCMGDGRTDLTAAQVRLRQLVGANLTRLKQTSATRAPA